MKEIQESSNNKAKPRSVFNFTKKLFFGDMLLNWFLSGVLIVTPQYINRLLTGEQFFPIFVIRLIGTGFLIYSVWQIYVVIRGRKSDCGGLTSPALKTAAWAAFGPVLLLTAGLIVWSGIFKPLWTVLLWLGDGYMVLLGGWYLWLEKKRREHLSKQCF